MASFVSHSLRTTRLLPKLAGAARTSTRFQQTVSAYEESLFNQPDTEVTRLGSGLRVASEESGGSTCSVGVWLEAGSRFENAQNNGVAHFLEHMTFKGTHNRSASALENEIESMGAQLSAFTSREMTAFHARCFKKDLPQMMEILGDVVQNPLLDEEAIEDQRAVILNELKEVGKDQEKVVMDYLHKTAFQGTSMAQSVFGPTSNIKNLTKKDMQDYMSANYSAPRMVIAGAGGVAHGDLVQLAEKHFSELRTTYVDTDMVSAVRFTGSDVQHRDDDIPYLATALAIEGCGWAHADALPMLMAATISGSYDKSLSGVQHVAGPLITNTHECSSAHNYHSFVQNYTDTSLWGSYALGPKYDGIEDWVEILQDEWMRICTALTENEVTRARNLLKTNLLRELDGSASICADIGRQMLVYERRVPMVEMNKRLDAIDNTLVKEVAAKYIYDKCLVAASYGPTEGAPDYNRMRSSMYWLRL